MFIFYDFKQFTKVHFWRNFTCRLHKGVFWRCSKASFVRLHIRWMHRQFPKLDPNLDKYWKIVTSAWTDALSCINTIFRFSVIFFSCGLQYINAGGRGHFHAICNSPCVIQLNYNNSCPKPNRPLLWWHLTRKVSCLNINAFHQLPGPSSIFPRITHTESLFSDNLFFYLSKPFPRIVFRRTWR